MQKHLLTANQLCPELAEIENIEAMEHSFLCIAKNMRNYVTHRGGLPMAHYLNGPSSIVHPINRTEFEIDSLELLGLRRGAAIE